MVHSTGEIVDGYQEGESWADPVPIEKCAVAWGNSTEPYEANRDGVSLDGRVFGPPGWLPSPRDKLMIPGHDEPFDVIGYPRDWSVNPFDGTRGGTEVLFGRFDG